jgi:hypothetical protein
MSLVDHDDVVETLATDGPDQALSDGVRLRCRDGREHSADADRCRSAHEVRPSPRPRSRNRHRGVVFHGVAWTTWRHTHGAVGCAATFQCTILRRS